VISSYCVSVFELANVLAAFLHAIVGEMNHLLVGLAGTWNDGLKGL